MNNYAWSNRYRRNTVYVNGRRGSTITTQNRIGQTSRIESSKRRTNNTTRTRTTTKPRINNSNFVIEEEGVRWYSSDKPRVINTKPRINTKPKVNNSRPRVNNNPRPTPTIRTTPRTSPRSSNNTTVRSNSRRKN